MEGDFFLNTIGVWVISFMKNNPTFGSFLMFLGTARLAIKPLMTLLQIYVKWTPYDQDDKWFESLEGSKGYKLLIYMMDWLLSFKMPTSDKQ